MNEIALAMAILGAIALIAGIIVLMNPELRQRFAEAMSYDHPASAAWLTMDPQETADLVKHEKAAAGWLSYQFSPFVFIAVGLAMLIGGLLTLV